MSAPPRKRARRTTTGGKASSGGSGGGGGGYKLDEKILKALRGSKHGKTTDELVASCKAEGQEVALQLNKLSSKGLVQFAKNSDGKMIIILTSADQQKIKSAMVDLSNNAQHVYQTIGEKGRDGIWKREIKFKTGLVEKEVEKILKSLVKKNLVKMEKTVLRQN